MKLLTILSAILLLASCSEPNRFHEIIRTTTQTDKPISIVMVDSITYEDMLSEEYHKWGDMYIERLKQGADRNDSLNLEIQRAMNEIIEEKKKPGNKLMGFRITADLGSDRMVFLVDSAVTQATIEEQD